MAEVARLAKLLLGSCRRGEANDPQIYTAAVIAVLSDYPLEVIRRVVDPRTGLPSRLAYQPSIPELKAACDDIYGPIRRRREWGAGAVKQIQERARIDGLPIPSPSEIRHALAKQGITIDVDEILAITGPT